MAKPIVELFAHNLWANARLISFCSELTDEQLDATAPGTYGSVRNTLVHILANEEFYASFLTRRQPASPLFAVQGFPGFDDLYERGRNTGSTLIGVASKIRPDQIIKGSFQGQPYGVPASVLLIQAINHATEHRGQIASILSQVGVDVPSMDAWAFWQQSHSHTHGEGEEDHVHDHDHEHEHSH